MIQSTNKSILIEYLRDKYPDNHVYHVTSNYYKDSIIEGGLIKEFAITINQVNTLKELLENENFQDLNEQIDFGDFLGVKPIIEVIQDTFDNINHAEYTISASFDPNSIFNYLKEETKGGQYLKFLKQLIYKIKEKVQSNNDLRAYLNTDIKNIIDFIDKINDSEFIICIIDKSNLEPLDLEDDDRFQTNSDISAEKIIEIIEIIELSI